MVKRHTGDYCGGKQAFYTDMYKEGMTCVHPIYNCPGNHDCVGPEDNWSVPMNYYRDFAVPDDISELCGRELVEKQVDELYVMGGNFADLTNAEYNIQMDLESVRYVAEHCPVKKCYDIRQNGMCG